MVILERDSVPEGIIDMTAGEASNSVPAEAVIRIDRSIDMGDMEEEALRLGAMIRERGIRVHRELYNKWDTRACGGTGSLCKPHRSGRQASKTGNRAERRGKTYSGISAKSLSG